MPFRSSHLIAQLLVLALPCLAAAVAAADAEELELIGDQSAAVHAKAAVDAYHRLDVAELAEMTAEDFRFLEPARDIDRDLQEFLRMVRTIGSAYGDRTMEIQWLAAFPRPDAPHDDARRIADVRGQWTASDTRSDRTYDMAFSIRLEMERAKNGRWTLRRWQDTFQPGWLPLPVRGDGEHLSEHFRVRYLSAEFQSDDARRLAELAETWYARTSAFLGRSFEPGRRLLFDVASAHGAPYASAPGPDAFFLVSVRSARRDYGFSLVHELTHNLMGLSHLSRTDGKYSAGNRLLDEGFGVYVEERLVPEGRVYPAFGNELHRAYLDFAVEMAVDRPPILEAEGHRERGGDLRRLGYLQQSSFVKWLVDVAPGAEADAGVARFQRLFEQGLGVTEEIYGRSFAQLEAEWLAYLETLESADPD